MEFHQKKAKVRNIQTKLFVVLPEMFLAKTPKLSLNKHFIPKEKTLVERNDIRTHLNFWPQVCGFGAGL